MPKFSSAWRAMEHTIFPCFSPGTQCHSLEKRAAGVEGGKDTTEEVLVTISDNVLV